MAERSPPGPSAARLLEATLAGKGSLPLDQLLSECVDTARLRELVRKRGLSPKGFRVEAAPARSLAQALTRDLDAEVLREAFDELLAAWAKPAASVTPAVAVAPVAAQPCVEEQQEIVRLRAQLQAAHDATRAAQTETSNLASRLAREQQLVASLRGDVAAAERRGAFGPVAPTGADRDLARALHDANAELEVSARAEDESRRRLAEQQTEIRALRERVTELEELVPRGKRKKVEPPPPPLVGDRFRVPYFTPEFYRCLVSRDMRGADAAFDAVLRFATAGYGYPGLQVKQLEGVELWSMRAGIKTRVYFRPRADGDVDILAVGDREEQDTLLRRLR